MTPRRYTTVPRNEQNALEEDANVVAVARVVSHDVVTCSLEVDANLVPVADVVLHCVGI